MWGQLPSYLEGAEAAARWIRSAARETEHGLVWLPEPDHPERLTTVTAPATLYSGSAGIVIFLLELAAATGDASYLADARRGADQLGATWRGSTPRPATRDSLRPPGRAPGMSRRWRPCAGTRRCSSTARRT